MSCRILVVEDSPTQAAALGILLEQAGNEVVVARSAESALEQVAVMEFDLVLTDVVMPGMNGYELCKVLKDGPSSRNIPVVLLTSLSDPMDIVQGLECGADNYITKPYDPDHLLARVRHVQDNRQFRLNAKTSLGVNVRFLGRDLAITSEKEQILDLFISSVEDVVRMNSALLQSQRALADAHAKLEAFAEEKAREARVSDARYRALLHNAGDAVIVLDSDARIVEANPRASDLLTRSANELSHQKLIDLLPAAGLEEFRAGLLRLPLDRQMVLGEKSFVDVSGNEVWCEMMASATRVDGKELVLLIARDVTARRQTEHALIATNERLRTLVEASPLAILVIDVEGVLQLWNRAAERVFGWSAEEVLGRAPPFVPEEKLEEFRDYCERVMRGDSLSGVEVRRKRKDGSAVYVGIHAAPLRAQGGEVVGILGIIADLTERKRAEEAVREREEAKRANEAKSEFLSRMSHELRTPLNAILGFAQLLQLDHLSADQDESVDQILGAGGHLLALIDEVLDISQIEAGKLLVSREPVSVGAVVKEVCTLMRPLAAQQSVELTTDLGRDHAPAVLGDLQRLKQVLLNFVSNAVKYNRPGGGVRVYAAERGDGSVRIAVEDTGSGMSPQELDRLFVPFERLSAASRGIPGTGLGLNLARGLAEAMGGRVGVESRAGEGSTFWIELSVAEGQPRAVHSFATGERGSESDGAGKGSTVLYIEDNPPNLRLVERILATRPHIRLLTAMHASLGLDLAREHRPDLILLDRNLPDMPADEILDILRKDPELREVPVVVVSADAMPSQIKRMMEAGARDYLTKPLDVKRLLQVVDDLLEAVG